MQAIDIDGNYHDVSLDEVKWRPSAYAVVLDGDRVLLTKQQNEGYYLPGGGIEIDESLEDAVMREVKEETGIDIEIIKMIDVKDILFKLTFREPQEVWRSLILVYLCKKVGGDLDYSTGTVSESQYLRGAEWVEVDELDRLPSSTKSFDWKAIVRAAIT